MYISPEDDKQRIVKCLAGAALLTAAVALLFRNLPVGPILAGDEFQYSEMARKLPYRLDWIPNYLFYLIYGATNYCGAQFYSCSKIINVLFFSLSGLFVYKSAHLFTGRAYSLLFMSAYLLSPFNVYTTQFMPEVMYGAVAWMLVYFFISQGCSWRLRNVAIAGAGVACLSMIKPHGIFLGFIYLSAVICDMVQSGQKHLRLIVQRAGWFCAAFLIVRLPIGYLFARRQGLNVFGVSYSGVLTRHLQFADYLRIVELTAAIVFRHVIGMALIAGVPLCIIVARAFRTPITNPRLVRIVTFAAIFFTVMIAVTSAYTATVAGTDFGETTLRLHTRYYNFFDFLFYVIVLSELISPDPVRLSTKAVASTAIGLLALASIVYLPSHYQPGLMDNPDIHGLFWRNEWFFTFAILDTVLIGLWFWKSRAAALLVLTLQLPLSLYLSANLLTQDIRGMTEYHNAYPRAGDLARVIWGKPLPQFFVAGTEFGEEFHTILRLDKDGTRIQLAPNETLHRSVVPKGVSHGIIVGEHDTDFPYDVTFADGPIKIIQIESTR